MTDASPKRISLWSGPRNISTALMYSFAQRRDTEVFDEPLYAHYLTRTKAHEYHPGADEILKSQENDGTKVIENILLGQGGKPVRFYKNMAHHLVDLEWNFLGKLTNVLLTREPRDALVSYGRTITSFAQADVGYQKLVDIKDWLVKSGKPPIVLDSQILLRDPKGILKKLCRLIDLPFDEAMLSWESGPKEADGVWASHWYHGAHQSKGFQAYVPKEAPLPDEYETLLQECRKHYESLMNYAIAHG